MRKTNGMMWRAALWAAGLCLPAAALAQPAPSAELDRLADRAALQGQVRVIVGLKVSSQPEGLLTAQQALEQRQRIRTAQTEVGDRLLAGTASRAHARFETVPYLGVEVDANGMARLRASALVADIQEDGLARPGLLQSTQLVNAPVAWNAGYGGAGWNVAVLDTGVDKNHQFLAGKVVAEACYSSTTTTSSSLCPGGVVASTAADSGLHCNAAQYGSGCLHGTHVAGIVAGGVQSPDGSDGVGRDAGIIAMQVFSYFPGSAGVASYTSDQIKALERVYALSSTLKIAAVNMSLGGGLSSTTCDADARKAIIDTLRSVGIATVVSSGNDGQRGALSAPACISSAISVGSTCDAASSVTCLTGQNGVADYSNIASFVSLLAPGSFITSSVPGNGYASWNGTSMAAPHVAGAWAVIKHGQPGVSVADALAQLKANGLTVNDTRSGGTVTGMKRIDLAFAATPPAPPTQHTLTVARAGTGSGSVTSTPAGISCGTSCSKAYAAGTVVTLTVKAASGSRFAGWTGACTGTTTSCTVTMSSARSVTATFNKR